MSTTLRILMLEDDPYDAELEAATLEAAGFTCHWRRVESRADFLAQLAAPDFDLILADYNLPDFDGLTALKLFIGHDLDLPFILVSGALGEEIAIESLRAGATDYVLKNRLSRLGPVVKRALLEKEEKQRRRQVEAELRKLSRAVEQSPSLVIITDTSGAIEYVNPKFTQVTGYTLEEVIDQNPRLLKSGKMPLKEYERLWQTIRSGGEWRGEFHNKKKNGEFYWTSASISPIRDMAGTITHLLGVQEDITERKRAEAALGESEAQFRLLFERAPIGMAIVALDGRFLQVNPAFCHMVGYTTGELLARTFADITHPEDLATNLTLDEKLLGGELPYFQMEKRYISKMGKSIPALLTVTLVRDGQGQPLHFISQIMDFTERKQMDEQLRQAQKMEAVGRLAGGVAHDFNNILTVITGYCALLLDQFSYESDPVRQDIHQIKNAADRAATLTRQLLAFSRQQVIQPERLNLNEVVAGVDKMLRRLIGEDVDLVNAPGPNLGLIKADRGQIEQILLNLAINARDAMPQGGKLTIETANVELEKSYTDRHVNVRPGPYIMLAVSDTGLGMDAETKAHLFEPFFTTKEQGKGTGLGLSTVYGIVRQNGGHIWVYSEPGQGAVFKIYLPRLAEVDKPTSLEQQPLLIPVQGSETILLVEDELLVRELARRVLLIHGYTVLEARDGLEALQLCRGHSGPIHMLLTDIVMPGGMNGRQVAEQVTPFYPDLKVLYMSGYTNEAIVRHGVLEGNVAFLQKPFAPSDLVRKVREVLKAA